MLQVPVWAVAGWLKRITLSPPNASHEGKGSVGTMKGQKRGGRGGWQGGRQGYKSGNQGGKSGNQGGLKKYNEKNKGKDKR